MTVILGWFAFGCGPRGVVRQCPGPDVHPLWADEVQVGETLALRLHVCERWSRPLGTVWTVSDTQVAALEATNDTSGVLRGKAPGRVAVSAVIPGIPAEVTDTVEVVAGTESRN